MFADQSYEMFTEPVGQSAGTRTRQVAHKLNTSLFDTITQGKLTLSQNYEPTLISSRKQKAPNHSERTLRNSLNNRVVLEGKLRQLNNDIDVLKQQGGGSLRAQSKTIEICRSRMTEIKEQQQKIRAELSRRKQREVEKRKSLESNQSFLLGQMMKSRVDVKKRNIQQSLKELEQRAIQRQQVHGATNDRVKSILKEQKSRAKSISPYDIKNIQWNRTRLDQISEYFKPIDYGQLRQHQQKLGQYFRLKQDQWKGKLVADKLANPKLQVSYQSRYRKIKQQQDCEQYELQRQVQSMRRSRIMKRKQYADKVKETYKPEVDHKLTQEIKSRLQKEQTRLTDIHQRMERSEKLIKLKGGENLVHFKSLPKKPSLKYLGTQQPEELGPYKNYLVHTDRDNYNQWNQILTIDVDRVDKAVKMKLASERIQQQLQRKQENCRILGRRATEDIMKVDEDYYNMMKAKLSLLQIT